MDEGSFDLGGLDMLDYSALPQGQMAPNLTPQPVDAGGGAPGVYSQQVLDVFKYGLGAYTEIEKARMMNSYQQFTATQSGLATQGQAQMQYSMVMQSQRNMLTLLVMGVVAWAIVNHKRAG